MSRHQTRTTSCRCASIVVFACMVLTSNIRSALGLFLQQQRKTRTKSSLSLICAPQLRSPSVDYFGITRCRNICSNWGSKGQRAVYSSTRLMMTTKSTGSPSVPEESQKESSPSPILEIEQKFQLLGDENNIEQRLKELNFIPKQTIKFVDWYFDTDDIILSTKDYWLRYRGLLSSGHTDDESVVVKGSWQLKKGQNDPTSRTTVYKEIEGEKAVSTAISVLIDNSINTQRSTEGNKKATGDDCNTTFDGFEIPKMPSSEDHTDISCLLSPFCRIVTTRSSWVYNGEAADDSDNAYNGLDVDLDMTNSGYAVGEVEAVVEKDSEILNAKRRIQNLIDELTKSSRPPSLDDKKQREERPPLGKLEHFLVNHRPDHYKVCLESGSIQRK